RSSLKCCFRWRPESRRTLHNSCVAPRDISWYYAALLPSGGFLTTEGEKMAPINPSGVGVRCKVGGDTTTVDSDAICSELGGTVVPPKKPPSKVCGGCGAAMARVAEELGWSDGDLVKTSRAFLELAVQSTPAGRKLFKALARIDEDFAAAVTANPRVLGALIPSLALGSEFVRLLAGPSEERLDTLVFPRVTQRQFKNTISELRKGNNGREFRAALAFLEAEFAGWSRKSVIQL